jgi:hypothetical protein
MTSGNPVAMRHNHRDLHAMGKYVPALLVFSITLSAYLLLRVLEVSFMSDDYAFTILFTLKPHDVFDALAKVHMGELSLQPFRPAAFASFDLDHWIYGFDSVGFHLTNMLIHSASSVLLYFVLLSLSGNKLTSFASAVFFGLYAANVESVGWVAGRFDLMAGFWVLSTILLFFATGKWKNRKVLSLVLSSIAFFIALFSKENAASALLVFVAITILFSNGDTRTNWKWIISQIAVCIVFVSFRIWLFGNLAGDTFSTKSGYHERMALDYLGNNLWKDITFMLTPFNRAGGYLNEWVFFWISGLLLILVVLNVAYAKSRKPFYMLVLGILWMVGFLLPTLVMGDSGTDFGNSRFLYLPAMGLAIVFGLALGLRKKLLQFAAVAIFLVLLTFNTVALRNNVEVYHEASDIAIFNPIVINELKLIDQNLAPDTTLIIANMPVMYKGAHLSPTLFKDYIFYLTGVRIKNVAYIYKSTKDLPEWRNTITKHGQKYVIFVYSPVTHDISLLY